jgi:hypothetical protein
MYTVVVFGALHRLLCAVRPFDGTYCFQLQVDTEDGAIAFRNVGTYKAHYCTIIWKTTCVKFGRLRG